MAEIPVIKVEGLSKKYRIGLAQKTHNSLRDTIAGFVGSRFRRLTGKGLFGEGEDIIWALKDVSFEVNEGEVVGIVGRNGAGKSTLLKILSRITEPTAGRVELRGRVASLLEVGTGFHSELTGRENIYLYGAILGMTKKEIEKKFDEIITFAEIDKFLDTPIKRYSSGMQMRLAFAVSANLNPEILLIDEVLAVGDIAFQKKCLGKMDEVAKGGRTVFFVSHNMGAITRLCNSAIWLDSGEIKQIASASSIVEQYLLLGSKDIPETFIENKPDLDGQYKIIRVLNEKGEVSPELSCDEAITLELEYEVRRTAPGLFLFFNLRNSEGVVIFFSSIKDYDPEESWNIEPGIHVFTIEIPPRLLGAGTYFLSVGSRIPNSRYIDHHVDVCSFSMHDTRALRDEVRHGVISTLLQWRGKA